MKKGKEASIETKVILLGDSGVGKTSLIKVVTNGEFNENEFSSTYSSYRIKELKINSQNYSLNLWDTIGQEKFRSLSEIFFKGSDIAIFVYDITSKESFDNLNYWIGKLKENVPENKCIFGIVGNKTDEYRKQEVNENNAKEFAKSKGIKFAAVSAKMDPTSFENFLIELVKDASNNLLDKPENLSLKNQKKKKGKC